MGQSDFNQISTSRFLFLLLTNLQKQSVQSAFWWDPWNPSKAFSQVNGLHCLALLSTSLFDSIFVCKFSGFMWPTHFCLWPTSHLARPIFWQCFCYQLAALNRGQHAAKCYSKWSRDTRLQQGSLEGVQRSLIGLLNFAPWCYKKTFWPDKSIINTHDLINHIDYCRSPEICISLLACRSRPIWHCKLLSDFDNLVRLFRGTVCFCNAQFYLLERLWLKGNEPHIHYDSRIGWLIWIHV